MQASLSLVPDRVCGDCNVCCIVPKIDEPALQKLPGCRCPNAQPDNACAIYPTRPGACRNFYCGWRRFAFVDARLRPDRSSVFIRPTSDNKLALGPKGYAVIITLLDREALGATGLVATIFAALGAGLDAYLVVPGPPGYTSGRKRINEALGDAVARSDARAVGALLAEQYEEVRAGIDRTRQVVLRA
jgi:hypothetical protein